MPRDNTKPNWAAGIAFAAVVPVLAGVLWLSNARSLAAGAIGCAGFAVDALTLFKNGGTGTLTGAFAPGDRVRLAIDFKGAGSWELTGTLGRAEAHVTGYVIFTEERTTKQSFGGLINLLRQPPSSMTSGGSVNGAARVDLEIDVTKAGAGTITVNKTGSVSSVAPTVAGASCNAAKERIATR